MKRTKFGFTLIELLIVVAIIAILAAIAVPNFLEAQTRAKVARVLSDERSLATAIEAYAVDLNTYPPSAYDSPLFNDPGTANPPMTFESYMFMTTPVAYITAIPLDVFSPKIGTNQSMGWTAGSKNPFLYYAGYTTDTTIPDPTARRTMWVLLSVGPDQMNSVSVTLNDPTSEFDATNTPYASNSLNNAVNKAVMLKAGLRVHGGSMDVNPTSIAAADGGPWTDIQYDPSNGTNSHGDVEKVAGAGQLPNFVSR